METEYVTERYITIAFKGIAAILDKLQASNKFPDAPQYKVTTATGIDEWHDLDDKSATTDEEKAQLADYQKRLAEAQMKYYRRHTEACLMFGIAVDMPKDDAWVKRQEFAGITVPTDPLERELHWLNSELYGSPADLENIILGVMRASGTDEEVLSRMADNFQHKVGASGRDAVGETTDTDDEQDVVLQQSIRERDDRIRDEYGAKHVRQSK